MHILLVVVSLIASTSAIDCLERFISDVTYCVSSELVVKLTRSFILVRLVPSSLVILCVFMSVDRLFRVSFIIPTAMRNNIVHTN